MLFCPEAVAPAFATDPVAVALARPPMAIAPLPLAVVPVPMATVFAALAFELRPMAMDLSPDATADLLSVLFPPLLPPPIATEDSPVAVVSLPNADAPRPVAAETPAVEPDPNAVAPSASAMVALPTATA
jgi:hypothetical protein